MKSKQYTIDNRQVWWLLLVYCLLSTAYCFAQQSKTDSLKKVILTAKEDTNRVNALNELSKQLWQKGSYDTALIYANQALALANSLPNGVGRGGAANSYSNIGNVYYAQGNYPEALKNHFASLKIKEEIGDRRSIAASYNNIGSVYYRQGNYPEALNEYFASLKIKEEIDDRQGIANSYNNIGNVYYVQGNYPEALKNHFASLKIKEEIGDRQGIAGSYGNIGNVYHAQGNYPEVHQVERDSLFNLALKNHFACLKIMEEIGGRKGIANSYNNSGIIYYLQGNYPEALKNHFAALKIREEIGDRQGIAGSYGNIGNVFLKQNKIKEAGEYSAQSLVMAKEIGSKDDIKEAFQTLARCDSAEATTHPNPSQREGLWKSSLENYKMYIVYRDSLLNEENTKKSVQAQMQYEFDKKESMAKAEQEKKDAVQKSESRRQKIVLLLTSVFLILVLIFSAFIFRALRVTQKQKKLIEKQKKLVEEKQKEILDSIRYAKRIQDAILPTEKYIDKTLKRLNRPDPKGRNNK